MPSFSTLQIRLSYIIMLLKLDMYSHLAKQSVQSLRLARNPDSRATNGPGPRGGSCGKHLSSRAEVISCRNFSGARHRLRRAKQGNPILNCFILLRDSGFASVAYYTYMQRQCSIER